MRLKKWALEAGCFETEKGRNGRIIGNLQLVRIRIVLFPPIMGKAYYKKNILNNIDVVPYKPDVRADF